MDDEDTSRTGPTPGQADRILPAYDAVGERELSEAVHQALGFASVCWEPMDCTGVFEEDRVRQVAAELTGIIGQYADALAAREPHTVHPSRAKLRALIQQRWNEVLTAPQFPDVDQAQASLAVEVVLDALSAREPQH